jgi:hypothetical protein
MPGAGGLIRANGAIGISGRERDVAPHCSARRYLHQFVSLLN